MDGGNSFSVTTDSLFPVDTIGVMMGDSNYVFGTIADFEPVQGGGVAILDSYTGKVSVFSSDGTFMRSFGRKGSAPGEFQYPVKVTFFRSGLYAVQELTMGYVSVFDIDGNFITRWQMGNELCILPLDVMAFDDSSFVSYNFSMQFADNHCDVCYSLWRYHAITGEVLSRYFTWTGEANPSTDFCPAYLTAAADGKGKLYVSRIDSDSWMIEIYGESSVAIDTLMQFPERTRVPIASDSSSVYGIPVVSYMYSNGEVSTQAKTNLPGEYPLISDLEIGAEGSIWARRGVSSTNIWDVVSSSGEVLGVKHVLPLDSVQDIHLQTFDSSVYAFNHLSEDFPMIVKLDICD